MVRRAAAITSPCRKASDRIEDLRAIPWVFSWAQARVVLHDFADKGLLKAMAGEWSYFQTILANMEMVLAKSDMAIAAHYADLVEDTNGHAEHIINLVCLTLIPKMLENA